MSGYKVFAEGAPLTAADVNDFLMSQVVTTVSSEAEMLAIPGPVHGQLCYRQDKDVLARYRGGAWHLDEVTQRGTHGFGSATVTAANLVSAALVFAEPFETVPDVQTTLRAGLGGTAYLVPRALNVTATGFTLAVYNSSASSSSWTGTLLVGWVARG